jgi:hypothetical protein
MNDDARLDFLAVIGDSRSWNAIPNSPHEKFAEAYALCAISEHPWWGTQRLHYVGYDYDASRETHRRVCDLIRGVAN